MGDGIAAGCPSFYCRALKSYWLLLIPDAHRDVMAIATDVRLVLSIVPSLRVCQCHLFGVSSAVLSRSSQENFHEFGCGISLTFAVESLRVRLWHLFESASGIYSSFRYWNLFESGEWHWYRLALDRHLLALALAEIIGV